MMREFHLGDCMEGMKQFPDKYFELAIVDPPYGIGISSNPVRQAHEKNRGIQAYQTKNILKN